MVKYQIIIPTPKILPKNSVCIKDLAEKYQCMSITNGVEEVVKELCKATILNGKKFENILTNEKRLFYYDTTGKLDEILFKDGEFIDFNLLSEEDIENLKGEVKLKSRIQKIGDE